MGHAMCHELYRAAQEMQKSIAAFVAAPGADTLAKAREAWKIARIPDQKTEGLSLRQQDRR